MNKIIIPALLVILLTSCDNDSDTVQFIVLNESIENSNKMIANENSRIYQELEYKLQDPQTKTKAEVWQPKSKQLQKLSTEFKHAIDTLCRELKIEAGQKAGKVLYDVTNKKLVTALFQNRGRALELLNRLIVYKISILSITKPEEFVDNPILKKDLTDHIDTLKINLLTYAEANNKPRKDTNNLVKWFQNASVAGAIGILAKIQNDALMAENNLLNYFNSMVVSNYDGFDVYHELITQNSKYLRTGQTIEIKAGVGAFSLRAKPTIKINKIAIPIDMEGLSTYTMIINNKPGKYFIPVSVEFTKPDGTKNMISKNVAYEVVQ